MTKPDRCSRQIAQPSFAVEVRPCREQIVVEVHGEVDLATAPRLRDVVADAVDDGWSRLVVDLRAVSFMDSAGVHLLLDLKAMGQHGVECHMIDGRPEVHRVLELCELQDVLDHVEPAGV